MIDAFCIVWLLTTTCVDDNLKWINPVPDPPVPFHVRLVYGGATYDMAPGAVWHGIGCFDGTIRVTSVNDETGVESEEPLFFRWEGTPGTEAIGVDATGRFMEWDHAVPIGTDGMPEFRCE